MVIVFGDLIADLAIRITDFPVVAEDLKPISYLEIGPGGATNIAIMAARYGLKVSCIGEMGRDAFGDVVRRGLEREGIETADVVSRPESRTPVAGVLVDRQREPAYLGYSGKLLVRQLLNSWRAPIRDATAFFADGWIEIPEMASMILDALQLARSSGVRTFFDPGPGNPALDLEWHLKAAALANVLLLNEQEAQRLTQLQDPIAAAQFLLKQGSDLVVLKRGGNGLIAFTAAARADVEGFRVEPVDFTGAGDSVTGAVLYAISQEHDLKSLAVLANATGAAKVQKLGTGHNLPTRGEVREVLRQFAPEYDKLI